MRHSFFANALSRAPVVKGVLIALVSIYLLFAISVQTGVGANFFYLCALNPSEVFGHGYVWQLFTYAFLHEISDPFHLVFNCIIFFFIGPELEMRWGDKRFIIFITATILGGSLFVVLSFLLGISNQSVIGFSSVCLGLIIAWGVTFKDRMIYVFGMIPISGKGLILWTVAFEILYAISASHVSSAAHFGGMVAAAILTLGWWRPSRLKQYMRQMRFASHKNRWQ